MRSGLKQEKSCGALVFNIEDKIELLLIRHHKGGHWSFPKGHMKKKEREWETALREIKEETFVDADLDTSFRHTVTFSPKVGVKKTVVYFIGFAKTKETRPRPMEISEAAFFPIDEALSLLKFDNDKNLFAFAMDYLKEKGFTV